MSDVIYIDSYKFAAALRVEVGSFTLNTATGNQDVPISTNGTSLASGSWAIMFWSTFATTTPGTASAQMWGGVGFVANGGGSISQYATGVYEENGGTSNTSRRVAAAAFTRPNTSGTTSDGEFTFTSFVDSTHMRINKTTGSDAGQINYMIITGLTGAKVVNWTSPTTATTKAVTGVGFSPDLVFHGTSTMTALGSGTDSDLGFGAMNAAGQQFATAFGARDAFATSNTYRSQRTDKCLISLFQDAQSYQASFSSMDADGFTTSFDASDGSARNIVSLCIKGVQSKIGSFTTTASASSQTVTPSQGFTPKGLMFASIGGLTSETLTTQAIWSLGASDVTNQRVADMFDLDASNPSTVRSFWWDTLSMITNNTSSEYAKGSVTAVGVNSFDLSWTTPAGDARQFLYCLIG